MPRIGDRCHFDREYCFTSLGGFAGAPGRRMLYLLSSNDDRKTPAEEVMWTLRTTLPTTVHLNFRSDAHVSGPDGVRGWLARGGWRRNTKLVSTVSTGYPNGPYVGPVYSRAYPPGTVELLGSNCWGHLLRLRGGELLRGAGWRRW